VKFTHSFCSEQVFSGPAVISLSQLAVGKDDGKNVGRVFEESMGLNEESSDGTTDGCTLVLELGDELGVNETNTEGLLVESSEGIMLEILDGFELGVKEINTEGLLVE
jgi:hypothetical protein